MKKYLCTLFALLFVISARTSAQEMSAEWYRQKGISWAQTKREYPQSAHPGPFKTRILEIDAWAKENNPELYYNPNKPYLLAQLVQAERDEVARQTRSQSSNPERLAESNGTRVSKDPPISYDWWVPIVGSGFLVLGLLVVLTPCWIAAWVGWGKEPLCRSKYWGHFLFSSVGFAIAGVLQNSPERASVVAGAVICFVVAMMLSFSIGRRLRNMGWQRWSAIVLPVPFFPILLLFWPPYRTKPSIGPDPAA